MEKQNKLTVIILTKNEAGNIEKCLISVDLLQNKDILVIDDGSTDKTVQIAQNLGAKVIHYVKKDFADARNFGKNLASGDWIFYIDADERLTQELATQIKQVIKFSDTVAYKINRENYYLGKKWPKVEQLERLFKKSHLIEWYGPVHESPKVNGKIGKLNGSLQHFTHKSLSEMVANTLVWSEIEANLRYQAKHPLVTWWRIPRLMIPTFWDYYIVQGGWRAGTVGLIESIYQAFSIFITYARLWEMQQK